MASQSVKHVGAEARYLQRFAKLGNVSGDSIKNVDAARKVTEHLSLAKASLSAQEANTRALFSTAQEMVSGIDTLQQMMGHTFVRNMPLPSKEIMESPSKQLGYIQLTMRFLQAGVLHFMEEMSNAQDRIESLEKLVGDIAEYDQEVNILGDIQSLDLESLDSPRSTLEAEKSVPVPLATPPTTPHKEVKSSSSKDVKKAKSKN